jgi:hypothetical protein
MKIYIVESVAFNEHTEILHVNSDLNKTIEYVDKCKSPYDEDDNYEIGVFEFVSKEGSTEFVYSKQVYERIFK